MRIDLITVVPEMLDGFVNTSILARAQRKGLVEIHVHNLRDYTTDKHRRVDDYPYGGAAGMVIQCQPVDACIAALKAERHYDEIIFTAPDGERFNQRVANELSLCENIIILCGHYKGVDYRIREHLVTREISDGRRTCRGVHYGRHCAHRPRSHRRRTECPLRLLSRQPARATRLYPSGGIQGMEGSGHPPFGARCKNSAVGDGAGHGTYATPQTRPLGTVAPHEPIPYAHPRLW